LTKLLAARKDKGEEVEFTSGLPVGPRTQSRKSKECFSPDSALGAPGQPGAETPSLPPAVQR